MVLDFSWLPPEINSSLIFGGAGSGSLFAAAQAWEGLAQDLASSAASFGSVLTQLSSGPWSGPASAAMTAAAAPYVAWLQAAAAQAAAAGGQASAAAGAFEAAQAATVHPLAVTTNRVTLTSLVATNILGQNTPAIFANEFDYVEMWAQDVAAMLGYQGGATAVAASMSAAALPAAPLSLAGLEGAVTGALGGVEAVIPTAMTGVESIASALPLSSLESVAQVAMYPASMAISPLMSAIQMAMQSANAGGMAGAGAAAGAAGLVSADAPKMVGDIKPMGGGGLGGLGGGGMSGGLGNARLVGAMSVPPNWQGSMPGRMASAAMMGLGEGGAPAAAAMAGAGAGGGGMPMMPMPMGGGGAGGGMPGGPLGRGGASPHVQQNRPSVIPRTGVG